MARTYSDHYSNGVAILGAASAYDQQYKTPRYLGHTPMYCKVSRVTLGLAAIGDEIRMMTLRSGDRLGQLFINSDALSTGLAADLGLYKFKNGVGAVIDADLYGSALAINGGFARADQFTEAGTLDDQDRWKPLWEQAAVGAGTDTEDPQEPWDIVLTATGALSAAVTEIIIEAWYLSD